MNVLKVLVIYLSNLMVYSYFNKVPINIIFLSESWMQYKNLRMLSKCQVFVAIIISLYFS